VKHFDHHGHLNNNLRLKEASFDTGEQVAVIGMVRELDDADGCRCKVLLPVSEWVSELITLWWDYWLGSSQPLYIYLLWSTIYYAPLGVRAPLHRRVQQIQGLLWLGRAVLEGPHPHALHHHHRHATILPGTIRRWLHFFTHFYSSCSYFTCILTCYQLDWYDWYSTQGDSLPILPCISTIPNRKPIILDKDIIQRSLMVPKQYSPNNSSVGRWFYPCSQIAFLSLYPVLIILLYYFGAWVVKYSGHQSIQSCSVVSYCFWL